MPIVVIPAPYRGPTRGAQELRVDGQSVRECLDAVERAHPGFRELVLDESGVTHRFVKLFVNEEQIDSSSLDTSLEEGDRLEILAAIAGG